MRRRPALLTAALPAAAVALAACGGSSSGTGSGGSGSGGSHAANAGPLTIVVSAPLSTNPWVGDATRDGAQLAVSQLDAAGGIAFGAGKRLLRLDVRDNAGSPSRAVDDARAAVSEHALALITDGTGAVAAAQVTGPAHLPEFVTFDGAASIVDAAARPQVYRIAPANAVMARRLADYLAARQPRIAVLHDDTGYGRDGGSALEQAFTHDKLSLTSDTEVATGADPAPAVVQALQGKPTAIAVWATGPTLAQVVKAVRAASSTVAIFTSPTGEDPIVRQQTAGVAGGVEGLTFVSFRITAEVGPPPYDAWRAAYVKQFGVEKTGLTADDTPVIEPPDWAMFPYDAVKLVSAAAAGGVTDAALMTAMETTSITGANGDDYGFSGDNREGVSQGDIYFGKFHDDRFVPVTDDLLGPKLPTVPQ